MNSNSLLFVYGTLLNGFSLHPHLQKPSIQFLGKGTIQGRLYDLGEYPGGVAGASSRIQGELYELSDPAELENLDRIEGYDPEDPDKSLFVRRSVTAHLETGEKFSAWVYLLSAEPTKAMLIRSGDYRQYRESK